MGRRHIAGATTIYTKVKATLPFSETCVNYEIGPGLLGLGMDSGRVLQLTTPLDGDNYFSMPKLTTSDFCSILAGKWNKISDKLV